MIDWMNPPGFWRAPLTMSQSSDGEGISGILNMSQNRLIAPLAAPRRKAPPYFLAAFQSEAPVIGAPDLPQGSI